MLVMFGVTDPTKVAGHDHQGCYARYGRIREAGVIRSHRPAADPSPKVRGSGTREGRC
jgi:hypothetical protein